MANPEHLEILKQGAEAWNEWVSEHKNIRPDLSGAILRNAHLSDAILRNADLSDASLFGAYLSCTNFFGADLSRANLFGTYLDRADLRRANLFGAYLSGADLSRADLSEATLSRSFMNGAHFTNSKMGDTTLAGIDLSEARGLETVEHLAPSTIGIDTIYKSAGKISEVFMRGCGVPEPFIVQIPALVGALQPIQFYSCFISYSSKDQDFAERLYADLNRKGVRCWFAPEDLKIGAEIRTGIDESIRVHDKLLLVLTETSVKSQWVQQEVETALAKEREQKRTVLFPIRLDSAVTIVTTGWPAYLRNTRNIGDFTRWKDEGSYGKAFNRLLRDLKAEETKR